MAQKKIRLEKNRLKDQKRRDKRRADPVAYANYCEKERARNRARKEEGVQKKFKKFEDVTEREKRERRKNQLMWKDNYKTKHSVNHEVIAEQGPSRKSVSVSDSNSDTESDVNDFTNDATQQVCPDSQKKEEIINALKADVKRLKKELRIKGRQIAYEKEKKNKKVDQSQKKTEAHRKVITRLKVKLNQQNQEPAATYDEFKDSIEKSNLPKPLQKRVVSFFLQYAS